MTTITESDERHRRRFAAAAHKNDNGNYNNEKKTNTYTTELCLVGLAVLIGTGWISLVMMKLAAMIVVVVLLGLAFKYEKNREQKVEEVLGLSPQSELFYLECDFDDLSDGLPLADIIVPHGEIDRDDLSDDLLFSLAELIEEESLIRPHPVAQARDSETDSVIDQALGDSVSPPPDQQFTSLKQCVPIAPRPQVPIAPRPAQVSNIAAGNSKSLPASTRKGRKSKRGPYECKSCGVPKKGHQCPTKPMQRTLLENLIDRLPTSCAAREKCRGLLNPVRRREGNGEYICGNCGLIKTSHKCPIIKVDIKLIHELRKALPLEDADDLRGKLQAHVGI